MKPWPFHCGLTRLARKSIDERIQYFLSGQAEKDHKAHMAAEKLEAEKAARVVEEKATAEVEEEVVDEQPDQESEPPKKSKSKK